MKEKWAIEPLRWQLYRAKLLAKDGNDGSHTDSFKFLKKYMENLRSINLRTVVKFEHFERHNLDEIPKFKRVFVCFEAMKKGFLEGCRPFIGLDGCHLKGPFGGIALSAVALDGNKGVLPLL